MDGRNSVQRMHKIYWNKHPFVLIVVPIIVAIIGLVATVATGYIQKQSGFEKGHDIGYNHGYSIGYKDGYDEGYDEGYIVHPDITMILSFNPMGGSCSFDSKTVTYHKEYGWLPIPVKPGYYFEGWYVNSWYEGDLFTSKSFVTAKFDHVFYAKWLPEE